MTLPARSKEFGRNLPSASDREIANHLRQILASDPTIKIIGDDNARHEVVLTRALSDTLMELLRYVGNGEAVTIVPSEEFLTTQQAADILNVSRPYFTSLVDSGRIQCIKLNRHRRIKAKDLFKYKEERDKQRRTALESLAETDGKHL